jgi:hypothetical protein
LDDWCRSAQDDQNIKRLSHLYSNFRSSCDHRLITPPGLDAFKRALGVTDPSLLVKVPVEGGVANAIVNEARHQYYRPVGTTAGITLDFRISGRDIKYDDAEVFANLYMRPNPARLSSTGGATSRVTPPPATHRIIWLTRLERVFYRLDQAVHETRTQLSELQLFQEVVALLGLKPINSPQTIYGLRLFRARRGDVLRRPHALSHGYEDRFCGTSPYRPFGATADNRFGTNGLPEAIAFEVDLQLIPPSDAIYAGFRTQVEQRAPRVSGLVKAAPIEFLLDTMQVHRADLPYGRLQPIIIKRLRKNRKMCTYGGGTVPCYCQSGSSPAGTP